MMCGQEGDEMAQDILESSLAYLTSSSPQANTESSPLSSINISLLEEVRGQEFDIEMTSEIEDGRIRKPDQDEDTDEVDAEQARSITDMMEEIEAYTKDRSPIPTLAPTQTRETTLTPSSPEQRDIFYLPNIVSQATTLQAPSTKPPPTALSPASPNPRSDTNTCTGQTSSPFPSLSPQHIFLARIPGSAPLKARTIAKSTEWFAKLLTDGNGVDMIEMHKALGVRLYKTEELEAYQHLRSRAAAVEASRAEAVNMIDNHPEVGDVQPQKNASHVQNGWEVQQNRAEEATYGRKKLDIVSRHKAASPRPISNRVNKKASANIGLRASAVSTARTARAQIDNRPYTLRQRYAVDSRFHGNAFYAADGTPKTEKSRRKLEEKDRMGSEDVIRVYQ